MRSLVLTLIFVFLTGVSVFAQRFAYVDSEYILGHIPDFISAEKELDAMSKQWQAEVDKRLLEVDKLSKAFQADQVLLTDDMRKRRQAEIADKEKDARDFQNSKFGYQQELYKQRLKLISPIMDRIAKAVQTVAENLQLDAIYDKSAGGTLYMSPRLDKSNDVLQRLGYKPGNLVEK